MIRVYRPFWEWEDYNSGMWRKIDREDENKMLNEAINFTGDHKIYGGAMIEVVHKWPNTMEHNLTNASINKLAFIGHCAVQYKLNIPEYIVRMAWKHLSNEQRTLANEQALLAYKNWRYEYNKKKSAELY